MGWWERGKEGRGGVGWGGERRGGEGGKGWEREGIEGNRREEKGEIRKEGWHDQLPLVWASLIPRLSPLFRTASDGKLGGAWERG